MDRNRPGLGHSSTYGQACMQCYKAKCRCVPHPGGEACERKECQPSDSIRRRTAQRTEESDLRIAQLEGKIETLVSAMQSIVNSSGSSVNVGSLLGGDDISPSASGSTDVPGYSTGSSSIGEGPTPTTDTPPTAPSATDAVYPSPSPVAPDEAEESLSFFRDRMLPCFPFIELTPDVTAWNLRRDRPALLQAILTVTAFSTQTKVARAEDLRHLLFKSALMDVKSNMDLLLASLTYLAWSTDAFLGRADLVSRLMALAISLVYDLHLFKPQQPDVEIMMMMTQGPDYREGPIASDETLRSFVEKQRALLASFVLSCNVASHIGRQDALRWTPRMEEALRVIEVNDSCPTDAAFAFHVRLHVLRQRAAYMREQHEADMARTATPSATTSIPGLLYLKTLRAQLHELVSSFPPDLHQRDILVTYAHYIELYINQLAYAISWNSPLLNLSGQRSDGGALPGFERLECLWHSVENIKSWVHNFSNIPSAELIALPFHFWTQMILCTTVLKYLSVLGDPTWDCRAVRNTVDLVSAMDCMAQKLDTSAREAGIQCDDSLFSFLSNLLQKCRGWAESRLDAACQPPGVSLPPYQGNEPVTQSNDFHVPDLDQMVWMETMNLDSDQWLQGLLG